MSVTFMNFAKWKVIQSVITYVHRLDFVNSRQFPGYDGSGL